MHVYLQVIDYVYRIGCFKRFSQSSNLSAHEKNHLMAKTSNLEFNNQSQPSQIDPIFIENPLRLMINNHFTGTMNIKNLNRINSLYQLMHQIISNNYTRLNDNEFNKDSFIIKDTIKIPKTSIFNFSKGDRIFNIIKDYNHPRRRIIKIIYEDTDYQANEKQYDNNNYLNQDDEKIDANQVIDNNENNESPHDMLEEECIDDNNANEYEDNEHFFNNCYKSFLG